MIEQLLDTGRAPFITVRDGQMHVGGRACTELTVQIHEARAVRKLFAGRRLQCYSLDCRTGKNGRFCELCPQRRDCSRRLQLRLVYREEEEDRPAILEVSKFSFRAFDRLLQQIGDVDRLPEALVVISTVRTESGWTNLDFRVLF